MLASNKVVKHIKKKLDSCFIWIKYPLSGKRLTLLIEKTDLRSSIS